ncbi:cytochrome P450 [Epithele typhae]|uniref:cytochrome P450 n=1 Tax=Epithele typhae TaxID=378194 RepID=UPI002008E30E|nr:cytochrome P450 [Epithele typhae]KAH9910196.1 cytochrome P450 [Epithele typhae]
MASLSLVLVLPVAYLVLRVLRALSIKSPLHNLPGPPSKSLLWGNMDVLFGYDNWDFVRHLLDTYGPVASLNGFFGATLHIHDPKAVHSIYIKNADNFPRPPMAIESSKVLLGPGLLSTLGGAHRKQRKLLNPVFSIAYLRGLTPVFYEIVGRLEHALASRTQDGPRDLDMIGWMGRAALEIVGQGALGYSFDPLTADTKDEFAEAVKSFIPSTSDVTYGFAILPYVNDYVTPWMKDMFFSFWPDPAVHRMKRIIDLVDNRSRALYEEKKAAVKTGDDAALHGVGEGKDVMSILLRENMEATEEDKLPDMELLAQMSTFIVAGVDTTSNAMGRILDLLTAHPKVQERLRDEILEARDSFGKEIPFDEVMALPYLDAVCRETLRVYSPASFMMRDAATDFVLPLSSPVRGKDDTEISQLAVPKGTMIITSIHGCNTNKAIWGDDAYEWKPERWLEPLPAAVEETHLPGIYANQFTFSGGGYACIGFKFSQLEMSTLYPALLLVFTHHAILRDRVAYPSAKPGDRNPEMFLRVSLVTNSE